MKFSVDAGQAQDSFVKVKIEDSEDFPEPAAPKKMKLDDARNSEDKSLNESECDLLVEISEEEALGRGKRARTKSIYVKEAMDTALAKDNAS